MKIVVIDGATLNPGDLSWSGLEALGECEVHSRTSAEDVIERAAGAEAVLTNKIHFDARTLDALERLRYIGVMATGYNVVDVDAASARGITVTNVPAYGTASVAQATFALLLELTNHVGRADRNVRTRWPKSEDFCYWDDPIRELAGLCLGVVGLGRIGRAVARIGRAMDMNVIGHDPYAGDVPDIRMVELDALLAAADVVSLHCPQTAETQRLIDADALSRMKPSTLLLNLSRGGLIDEPALAAALDEGRLAGAALDVLSAEPPAPDHPLLAADRCIITPHVAWASKAARQRLLDTLVENLRSFLSGEPVNVVNPR